MARTETRIGRRNINLESALEEARRRFAAANPHSERHYQAACETLPGGNSRTVLFYEPFPLTIARGQGATVWDVDGHAYTDFIGEYTAGLYGHSHPKIAEVIGRVTDEGILLCGPSRYEGELASLMCARFPSCERVRFCNSGTEGNLMAFTAARAFTGRTHIMAFKGGYHGGVFLFMDGNHPINAPYPFVIGEYNDLDKTLPLVERHADELAAIVLEPLMGTGGALPAEREFLRGLRDAADKHGIVLIFDEVMTSRLSSGGLQKYFGVLPDMTTFGKYLGGGLTFGAFGGRADIMDQFDPRRDDCLPHAGTFNNNVLTMAAGVVGLRDVYTPQVAERHTARGDRFKDELNAIIAKRDVPAQVTGIGTILGVHFQSEPLRRPADAARTPPSARLLYHLEMLLAGFYTSKLGLLSPSLPLDENDYRAFLGAFDEYLQLAGPLLSPQT